MQRIDQLLESVSKASNAMDFCSFWPGDGAQIAGSFIDLDAVECYRGIECLREKMSPKQVAALFPTASFLRYFLTGNYLVGIKIARKQGSLNASSKEVSDNLEFLFDSLDTMTQGDPFCLKGTNPVWNEDESNNLLKESLDSAQNHPRLAPRLIAAAYSLVSSLYYDVYIAGGMEIHGPYPTDSGISLVYEFFDLNPPFWKTQKIMDRLRVIVEYQNTNASIDYFMHPSFSNPAEKKLERWAISTQNNGVWRTLKPNETAHFCTRIENAVIKQTAVVNNLALIDKIRKGAQIVYYQARGVRCAVRNSWEPPPEVLARVDNEGIRVWNKFSGLTDSPPDTNSIYDPRVDFVR